LIGEKLLHYHVTDRLGAGGMGEVYRAQDTRLGRSVAIKVPPAALGEDPERVRRLEREARALAALNHPGIASVYGLEEHEGRPFLVLELVEGETLAHLLFREVPPVPTALAICRQIAEALEVAHQHGLIHRDLKPSNVMLAKDGRVKLLDFGLAKATQDAAAGSEPASSATLSGQQTLSGVILGTTAYMSPEQARGKPLDRRVDIWAFGCVLYELLTGARAFPGETASDTLVSVLDREPDWSALPTATPETVRWLLKRCLQKDQDRRLRDIGDARLELEDLLEAGRPRGALRRGKVSGEARRGRGLGAWLVGCAAIVGGLAIAVALAIGALWPRSAEQSPDQRAVLREWRPGDAPSRPALARFDVALPPRLTLRESAVAVSPDGRQVAFAPRLGDERRLWLRSLDQSEARSLEGTEGALSPFWSPDGAEVAYFTTERGSLALRRIEVGTGAAREICRVPGTEGAGGTWGEGDRILFAAPGPDGRRRILAVSASGGTPRPVLQPNPDAGEEGYVAPELLPGGGFLFGVESDRPEVRAIWVAGPGGGDPRRVLPGVLHARYASSGYLLYVSDGAVQARRFDAERGEVAGAPVAIASPIAASERGPIGDPPFSVSRNGVLVYAQGAEAGRRLAWFDRTGNRLGTVGGPAPYVQVALAPGGSRVAAQVGGHGQDVWIVDLDSGAATRATTDPAEDIDPVWAADGRALYFASNRGRSGGFRLHRKPVPGDAPASPLIDVPGNAYPESVSPDGRYLVYLTGGGPRNDRVWALRLLAGAEPELLLKVDRGVDEPQVSPDGRWLAYSSQETGDWEVYVAPFRREGKSLRVSTGGGRQPKWRGDGRELLFVTPAGRLTAAEVRVSGDDLELGLPSPLFQAGATSDIYDEYAVTRDGQRFLVIGDTPAVPWSLNLVLNWTSLLDEGGADRVAEPGES